MKNLLIDIIVYATLLVILALIWTASPIMTDQSQTDQRAFNWYHENVTT